MKKPTKPRASDTNTRMHSILGDVISISNKPIKAPAKTAPRKKSK
jgi:hypothetical protein